MVNLNVEAMLARIEGALDTRLARIEGKVDLLQHTVDNLIDDGEDVETRLRALEAARLPKGLVAGLSGAVSACVALLAFLVML